MKIGRSIAAFAFVIFSSWAIAAQQATPTPDPDIVKISTALVQFDMTVTDNGGRVVPDVKADEVELYINGKKQKITSFSFVSSTSTEKQAQPKNEKVDAQQLALPPPPPKMRPEAVRRAIAVVVDDLQMSGPGIYYAKKALKKFVTEQMLDGDLVAIVRTGSGVGALQQFTNDKRLLFAAIDNLKWNVRSETPGAFAPIGKTPLEMVKSVGGAVSEESIAAEKARIADQQAFREGTFVTGTLGALKYVVNGMSQLPGRKAVVLLSDGFSLFGVDELGGRTISPVKEMLRKLIDEANRAAVVFYTIDMRGLEPGMLTAEDGAVRGYGKILATLAARQNDLIDKQEGPNILARGTGGFSVQNSNGFSQGLRKAIDDQSYYLIAYEPDTDTFDPTTLKFNDVRVKVLRKNANVRYRLGFYGTPDRETATPTTGALRNAIASPFAANGIDLRLNAMFGFADKVTYVRSLVHIDGHDLKFVDDPSGDKKVVLDILAVTFGPAIGTGERLAKTYTMTFSPAKAKEIAEKGLVYDFSFPVKMAGAFQYRIAVRDTASGKVGSVSEFIQVPDIKKKNVEVSTPLIFAVSPADKDKAARGEITPATSDLLTDTALRRFKRGSILQYGSQVYNLRPDSHVTTRVRIFRDGQLVLDGSERPLTVTGEKQPTLTGALDLGQVEAGDYVLQVIVTETKPGKKPRYTTQFVEFEVVQ